MKHSPLLCVSIFFATVASVFCGVSPAAAQSSSKPVSGILSGLVRDTAGTPQLGATVEVLSEAPGSYHRAAFPHQYARNPFRERN